MLLLVLVIVLVLLAHVSAVLGVVAFPFIGFAIARAVIRRWGLTGAQAPLFFILSAFLFSLLSPRGWETWVILATALVVFLLFIEEESPTSAFEGSTLGLLLRRAPLVIFFSVYLAFAAASRLASFTSSFGVPAAVAMSFLWAFAAQSILGIIYDARQGQKREKAVRVTQALVFGLLAGEAMLVTAFTPFVPLARATLLATLFWVAIKISEALDMRPPHVEKIAVSSAIGAIIVAVLFLTAPWP